MRDPMRREAQLDLCALRHELGFDPAGALADDAGAQGAPDAQAVDLLDAGNRALAEEAQQGRTIERFAIGERDAEAFARSGRGVTRCAAQPRSGSGGSSRRRRR